MPPTDHDLQSIIDILDEYAADQVLLQNELTTMLASATSGEGPPPKGAVVEHPDGLEIGSSFQATPRKLRDFGALVDGAIAHGLHKRFLEGKELEATELETRDLLDQVQPANPVETTVLRSMQLASAQQRQLLDLSARSRDPKQVARFGELALRAAREVGRSASVWREICRPDPSRIHVESGGQANVVGGDQFIHRSGEGGI